MNQTITDLLLAVMQDKIRANEPLQPPLSQADSAEFERNISQKLSYVPPSSYLSILHQTDGVDCNGIMLYASRQHYDHERFVIQGFLEANLILRGHTPNRNYLYFAESGIDLYRYDVLGDKYEICTRVGLRVMESFDTVNAFLERILNQMLE